MKHIKLTTNNQQPTTDKKSGIFKVVSGKLSVSSFGLNQNGFTLIELMVSVSIFAIVMTIAAGSLVSILDVNRKSQAIESVMNNLNFAIESMSRTMMFGSYYDCGDNSILTPSDIKTATLLECTSPPKTAVTFLHNDGTKVLTYKYDEIDSGNHTGQIEVNTRDDSGNDSGFVGVTSREIKITDLKFYVVRAANSQPRVFVTVNGYADVTNKGQKSYFNLQTTI